ncbi:sulfur oxidation c-type cytochrome SoxX [Thiohalocapsa halophila]|uniref:Sulfur oxidation c-type cytochrome SoxX n=2 Tax=Thiohalocapsa halophila TaxID=69359 RepID=A0ABS1CHE8_9GAMM|nr:sulfur oxidation c-type cytochrome SoxX [Thiohalocapsa halophila]
MLATATTAAPPAPEAAYTAMSPEELADYLIFEAGGFDLDAQTQDGGTARERMTQDRTQKVCSAIARSGKDLDRATAAKISALADDSIEYPDGGVELGDWKRGEEIARSGYGYRIGHRVDDHDSRTPGGNCYACHQLDPNEIAYGTVGPSLTGYGRLRGASDAMLKHTYQILYNPNLFFPCTTMPRFGHHGTLTQAQIADVMAYLLDPESPVNQEPPKTADAEQAAAD